MAKISLSEALARPSTVNEEILDATTDEDIRRQQADDGYADLDVPETARRVMPPRELRVSLGLTQQEMADGLRIPVATWRNWETGRVRLDPAVRSLLDIVAANPAMAFASLQGTKSAPAVVDQPPRVSLETATELALGSIERALGLNMPTAPFVVREAALAAPTVIVSPKGRRRVRPLADT